MGLGLSKLVRQGVDQILSNIYWSYQQLSPISLFQMLDMIQIIQIVATLLGKQSDQQFDTISVFNKFVDIDHIIEVSLQEMIFSNLRCVDEMWRAVLYANFVKKLLQHDDVSCLLDFLPCFLVDFYAVEIVSFAVRNIEVHVLWCPFISDLSNFLGQESPIMVTFPKQIS